MFKKIIVLVIVSVLLMGCEKVEEAQQGLESLQDARDKFQFNEEENELIDGLDSSEESTPEPTVAPAVQPVSNPEPRWVKAQEAGDFISGWELEKSNNCWMIRPPVDGALNKLICTEQGAQEYYERHWSVDTNGDLWVYVTQ